MVKPSVLIDVVCHTGDFHQQFGAAGSARFDANQSKVTRRVHHSDGRRSPGNCALMYIIILSISCTRSLPPAVHIIPAQSKADIFHFSFFIKYVYARNCHIRKTAQSVMDSGSISPPPPRRYS